MHSSVLVPVSSTNTPVGVAVLEFGLLMLMCFESSEMEMCCLIEDGVASCWWLG